MSASDKSNDLPQLEEFGSEEVKAIDQVMGIAQKLAGIQLTERHRSMVKSRLIKRLKELNLESISDYVRYFHENSVSESPFLIGLLTTHHTYFFREFSHFEYLSNIVIPALLPRLKARPDKKLRIWSAACSRGHEVYSLAMYLDFHLKKIDPGLKYEIVGSDIDPESVAAAENGVYSRAELKDAPLIYLANHWIRGTGDISDFVKAKSSLTAHCRFFTANLNELKSISHLLSGNQFDVIFCRNVFIYFNQNQIKSITQELLSHLNPEGYLFIGISETLSGLNLEVGSPSPSVYQHKQCYESKNMRRSPSPSQVSTSSIKESMPSLIRVLCVDDSPSILALLKRVFSKESGFDVIGTAMNGLEASKKVAELKPDVMTLDIHMPEQTGIEYLEKNYKKGHPPVVMITSVSREDAALAGKALQLGASDYVEKPTLTQLNQRSEEIRTKVKSVVKLSGQPPAQLSQIDREFQVSSRIKDLDSKLRIVVFSKSSRTKVRSLMNDFKESQPCTLFFLEGENGSLTELATDLSSELGKKVVFQEKVPLALKPEEIYLLNSELQLEAIQKKFGDRQTSILVFNEVTQSLSKKLLSFSGAQILLEDLGSGKGTLPLMNFASDIVLSSSFAYLSNEYFCKEMSKTKLLKVS